ncbi:MAG TPA: hypothetical protein VFX28_04595, partial [Methylomirabilota bacterium]|nr:hypothetical protein [Methylomirabilota bacterium]
ESPPCTARTWGFSVLRGVVLGKENARSWGRRRAMHMWGPGPWASPMGAFWWILPLLGLLIGLFFVIAMVRMMSGGGHFMCMGPHHDDGAEMAKLRREVEALRDEVRSRAAR